MKQFSDASDAEDEASVWTLNLQKWSCDLTSWDIWLFFICWSQVSWCVTNERTSLYTWPWIWSPPQPSDPPAGGAVSLLHTRLAHCRGKNSNFYWGFVWTHPDVWATVDLIWDLLLSFWIASHCISFTEFKGDSVMKNESFSKSHISLWPSVITILHFYFILHFCFTFSIICLLVFFLPIWLCFSPFNFVCFWPASLHRLPTYSFRILACITYIFLHSAHEHQGAPNLHHQFLTSVCLHTSKPDSHMLLYSITQI